MAAWNHVLGVAAEVMDAHSDEDFMPIEDLVWRTSAAFRPHDAIISSSLRQNDIAVT